jgi:hypothetical protein
VREVNPGKARIERTVGQEEPATKKRGEHDVQQIAIGT